ncbi:maltose alpha-D-glucosyltransferase [Fibrella aestuarina BUZ 2]|uniref:Maltose alpha-D-glucosyltransferase n=1 Tax=Fibrella aestuarina BUZ 2 TaxID=1166018 RepID=I0KBB9_9BACT|nr:alpha-amylase family protein [Fibrella aestuarina]CCH01422.1 maltose alpha-D-glucosyltransferase [Fibrella aestuarina BUZ 2]
MRRVLLTLLLPLLLPTYKATGQPRPTDFIQELWYKKGVVYNLDVKVFQDSDGDGVGDFNGLTRRLDYLSDLGVTVLWLAPFQPSPNQDDGYDISDFYGIDARLGTQADLRNFIQQAKKRGIRVVMDLVVNHTSSQHPWFQQARRNKESPYRSWYVWSQQRPRDWNKGMIFPGVQHETWSYDSLAGAYFYHRFYRFQPDLNAQNPAVQAELRNVVRHWLALGIDGFRLDAVPFFIEVPGTSVNNPDLQFDLLMWLRQFIQWQKGDALLLGETNVAPKENKQYFGQYGEGMQMMFNFYVNQFLFYALATGDVGTLEKALEATRDVPTTAQWAFFLRNHDEIDLGRLSKRQREAVYARMGPDKNMQLYERGIRRRLAPMLANPAQLRMAYSLLFALPGTPVLRYGEEIGMGDDLRLKERLAIRTPMQWLAGPNGGFTTARQPIRPPIQQGPYRYANVNVTAQRQDSASLLTHIRRLIRLRKQYPEIGQGVWQLRKSHSPHVLILASEGPNRTVVTVHNFSPHPQTIRGLFEGARGARGIGINGKTGPSPIDKTGDIQLPGYGYGWFTIEPKTNPVPPDGKSTSGRATPTGRGR